MTLFPRGISLRLFFVILALMVLLSWQFIERSREHIETGMQQAVEVTLVDIANMLAASVEAQSERSGKLDTRQLDEQIHQAQQRKLDAQIYSYHKQRMDIGVYVTNAKGIVIYDSKKEAVGQDYSRWNDVYLTLHGRYGARSSYINAEQSKDGDPKQMVIGVPIRLNGNIIGMLAVTQPNSVHSVLRLENWNTLRWLVLSYLTFALLVLILMAWWLALSLRRITRYAVAMAENDPVQQPRFGDVYLRRLAESLTYLRKELDGKQTVEEYVHGLTHELKTPLTSIHAAAEFLSEANLSANERERFIGQISRASERMHVLIERLLKLARLENRAQIEQPEDVALVDVVNYVTQDCSPSLYKKQLKIDTSNIAALSVRGDRMLIEQAISNLLDNAIDFATPGSTISLSVEIVGQWIEIRVHNHGFAIPDYALPKLTERFFSLPRADAAPRSSGLGLSFVAQIMALHGGKLSVRNCKNGVCATLFFPVKQIRSIA